MSSVQFYMRFTNRKSRLYIYVGGCFLVPSPFFLPPQHVYMQDGSWVRCPLFVQQSLQVALFFYLLESLDLVALLEVVPIHQRNAAFGAFSYLRCILLTLLQLIEDSYRKSVSGETKQYEL